MIQLPHIKARVVRWEELARGLAKEVVHWKGAADPLQRVEHQTYLDAVQDALAAADEARVVLVGVVKTLEQSRC